jgi:CBS domain-containing protein
MRISNRGNSGQFAIPKSEGMKEVMIANFACCTLENTVQEAAEMMVKHDCGEIAVVESVETLKPIGVITDRDITWRVVAVGKSPSETSVGDAM